MMKRQINLGLDCHFDRTDKTEDEMLIKLLKLPDGGRDRDWNRMGNILRMRYNENLTLQQIGQRVNLSRERVRAIINIAIRKIQSQIYKREAWKCEEPEIKVLIKEKVKHFPSWEMFKKHNGWLQVRLQKTRS